MKHPKNPNYIVTEIMSADQSTYPELTEANPGRRKFLQKGVIVSAGIIATSNAVSNSIAEDNTVPPKAITSSDTEAVIPGKAVSIIFDEPRCIHAHFCTFGSTEVFNEDGENWIHPDEDTVDNITHTIRQCPSGALQYKRHDGGPEETAPSVNLVRLRENGPLAVHADMQIGDSEYYRATLCRCGQSKNKPFCDLSHKTINFQATGEPSSTEAKQELAELNGKLNIAPLRNGPYQIAGNCEVASGTGAPIAAIKDPQKVLLCRCGQSKNKPFCDNSHLQTNFQAPGLEA